MVTILIQSVTILIRIMINVTKSVTGLIKPMTILIRPVTILIKIIAKAINTEVVSKAAIASSRCIGKRSRNAFIKKKMLRLRSA